MSISLTGTLLTPTGAVAANAGIRITSLTLGVNDLGKGSVTKYQCSAAGAYSLDLAYGNHRIEYRFDDEWLFQADVVVNDQIPVGVNTFSELFSASVPATPEVVLELQLLVAEANTAAAATAADRVQTGLDATATAADRVQTGLDAASVSANQLQVASDAAATAADRVATADDAAATAADRVQTGLDATATAADRVQTGLDAAATAADRVQTGLDVISTNDDASAAAASAAEAAALVAGAKIWQGAWDASTGVYPSNPTVGYFWTISVGGIISSIPYEVGDEMGWDGTNWVKIPIPDAINTSTQAALDDKLGITGGTLLGDLEIDKVNPSVTLVRDSVNDKIVRVRLANDLLEISKVNSSGTELKKILVADIDGDVDLYSNNVKKISATSGGATVQGGISALNNVSVLVDSAPAQDYHLTRKDYVDDRVLNKNWVLKWTGGGSSSSVLNSWGTGFYRIEMAGATDGHYQYINVSTYPGIGGSVHVFYEGGSTVSDLLGNSYTLVLNRNDGRFEVINTAGAKFNISKIWKAE